MIVKRFTEIIGELNKISSLRFIKEDFPMVGVELLKIELAEERRKECKKDCKEEKKGKK